ncbi:DUF7261 family protein [Natronomonas sp. EA1]|uniref:DUF7261 family protein n=1 Tax=Natronomonas sp. EA1 TaxID=3421655 RepID=UPI003EBA51D8
MNRRGRGQLVLVAAAVVAVALVPMVLAYLQLGYHADVAASAEYDDIEENTVRVLERATHEASVGIPHNHSWGERETAVTRVRERLRPRLRTLERSRLDTGTAIRISYNESAARTVAREQCPGGAGREFGPCIAREGVVVQNRVGETHPLAVAYDVRVVTDRGETAMTVVVETVG